MGTTRSRWRRWRLPLVAAVAVVALAVIGLHGRLPDPRDILTVLAGADWGWILLAAFLQTVSLVAFAYQQRRILVAMGVPMGRRDALGITLASTAISIALPAGAVASTGYSIREYERAARPASSAPPRRWSPASPRSAGSACSTSPTRSRSWSTAPIRSSTGSRSRSWAHSPR
ncbi:lysylphosphatidylglycerol synthase domain-containing protein [Phytohabitans flavus]|uniref:lysylphosphatidylglycerol synthase domain-containing protein n=1 Tax=Phytohabitans flavus TaxID=1076124 RepID=UPI00363967E8